MDGLWNTISGMPEVGQLIFALAILAGIVFAGLALIRIFGPVGDGAGKAIGGIGSVFDGAGAFLEGAGSLFGLRDWLQGKAAADVQRAKNEEEVFNFVMEAGDGRKLTINGHGTRTAPTLAERLTDVPQLPAPPEVRLITGKTKK